VLAFGFVYIHPFEDGNGRIHRYLMHHVLARRGFNPAGVHFPVSAAILDKIAEYKSVLESYSGRLLPHIKWEMAQKGNVKVLNDTADFYRFFDATPHAEFLYACVRQTIEQDLPNETRYLQNLDAFRAGVENLRQNGGRLSKRAGERICRADCGRGCQN
jgi:Fic family protein